MVYLELQIIENAPRCSGYNFQQPLPTLLHCSDGRDAMQGLLFEVGETMASTTNGILISIHCVTWARRNEWKSMQRHYNI